jgi:hypothetical protein
MDRWIAEWINGCFEGALQNANSLSLRNSAHSQQSFANSRTLAIRIFHYQFANNATTVLSK